MIRRLRGPTPGDIGAVTLAVLVLGGPALFTRGGFALDYTNHLWLVYAQTDAIRAHLVPTYYISTPQTGVFFPFFMFYGGTLYALAGGIGAALAGSGDAAYIIVILLSVAGAYGGLVWLSRQLGVRGWTAHPPAITFAASAYYVTNLYGRGAWPEFVATSAIPLLVASGWQIARCDRVRFIPAALFVIAAVIFAGSHNVTLLLGSAYLVIATLVLRLTAGAHVWTGRRRQLLWLASLSVLALGVDAWFLLPDVVNGAKTVAGSKPVASWADTGFLNSPSVVFDPLRTVPAASSTPALFVQAPDWFLAWAIGAAAVLWARGERMVFKVLLGLLTLVVVILVPILSSRAWDVLPHLLREVQFPYRLNTYVALSAAGAVLAGTLGISSPRGRPSRLLSAALAAVTAISIGLCVWQLWVPNTLLSSSYRNRSVVPHSAHILPKTWYAPSDYADASPPLLSQPTRTITVPPNEVSSNRTVLRLPAASGLGWFTTNIAAGPYAATVGDDLARVGRDASGLQVVRRVHAFTGPVTLSLGPSGGAVTIGRDATVVALLALLIVALRVAFEAPVAQLGRHPPPETLS